jgi:putative transposase
MNKKKRLEPFKKVRRIRTAPFSDRGTLFTEKNLLDGFVEFESLLEEGLFLLLDHDPHCIDMESQPVKIPNKHNRIIYIPDAWGKFIDGTQFIFDVKYQEYLNALEENPEEVKKWKARTECIEEFCNKDGLLYMIVTDAEIRTERLNNVQFFRKNKRVSELLSEIQPLIEAILNEKDVMSRIDLALYVSKKLGIDVKEVIPSIDHLIFLDFFLLDFETNITDDTLLRLKSDHASKILPLYYYFSSIQKTKPVKKQNDLLSFQIAQEDPNYNSVSQQEFLALPEHVRNKILYQIELLDIFKCKDISTTELKEFAKKKGISLATLYRWKNSYEYLGWRGLIPEHQKAGRKKGFTPEVEELVREVIEKRYLAVSQPSMRGCHRFLEIECMKRKLDPPCYNTFRSRIQEISNTKRTLMRRGRKVLRDHFRSLDGEYPFGNHPLDVVEFDHTIPDIMLVDQIDRKPIGRPRLTLAIDVYSRMIYGYYLSFDAPDLLAIGMSFLTGILPKDSLTTRFETDNLWPIYGLPKRILIDNSKEFKSGGLFNFCKLYNIQMTFCPPKTPDAKPHIERVIKTINHAIRDDLVGGYVLSLSEKRKTGYDPEKTAIMTIDEFEKWLVQWIVDDYHQRIHTGIKEKEGMEITPYERYEQGLANSDGKTVGLPNIPPNWEQLRFDVLPFKKRTLQRGGIRLFGLEYNAPIIEQVRATQRSQKREYIVKYDPRDIREVYLWVDSGNKAENGQYKRYFTIPLKNAYYAPLKINPEDSADYPVSLKEFEAIKRSRKKKIPVSHQELVKALDKRQKLIEESKKKTKTAKKARKHKEKRFDHKTKTTSTAIRKGKKKSIETTIEENKEEEDELLPPPPENIAVRYGSQPAEDEKEGELLPPPPQTLPRMKKRNS